MANNTVFQTLNSINVNEHVEKKKSGSKKNEHTGAWEDNYLSYLSWSWAWAEAKKNYPNISYEIVMNDGLPYVYDENTGYMVFTTVTIEDTTHMMWLPVMDGANNAMKSKPYSYTTKNGKEVMVAQATMFDINKTIMRCLVKNLAMFGLGLYIYAGEDLPENEDTQEKPAKVSKKTEQIAEADAKAKVIAYVKRHNFSVEKIGQLCNYYQVESLNKLTLKNCQDYINEIQNKGGNINE